MSSCLIAFMVAVGCACLSIAYFYITYVVNDKPKPVVIEETMQSKQAVEAWTVAGIGAIVIVLALLFCTH